MTPRRLLLLSLPVSLLLRCLRAQSAAGGLCPGSGGIASDRQQQGPRRGSRPRLQRRSAAHGGRPGDERGAPILPDRGFGALGPTAAGPSHAKQRPSGQVRSPHGAAGGRFQGSPRGGSAKRGAGSEHDPGAGHVPDGGNAGASAGPDGGEKPRDGGHLPHAAPNQSGGERATPGREPAAACGGGRAVQSFCRRSRHTGAA